MKTNEPQAADNGHPGNLLDRGVSRRVFFTGAAVTVIAACSGEISLGQESSHKPTLTDGPTPCDGPCRIHPFILVKRNATDTGLRDRADEKDEKEIAKRSGTLGPESINIRFIDPSSGAELSKLKTGDECVIVADVSNLGSGPAYSLGVDFFVHTSYLKHAGKTNNIYNLASVKQGRVLMQGDHLEVKSDPWTITFPPESKDGSVIVRAYDPVSDHFDLHGTFFVVTEDRHLAHRAYSSV